MRTFFLSFCLPLVFCLSPAHAGERSDTARSISMTCGGTKVEIVCGYNEKPSEIDDRVCSHNTLTFTLPDGKVIAATPEVQLANIHALIRAAEAKNLSIHDTAYILAIARIESGFNHDAAAGTTSASGLGQFMADNQKTWWWINHA